MTQPTRSRRRTCWRARRSPGSTTSAPRSWSCRAPTTSGWCGPSPTRIVESLRARGVDVEYLVFDDEGHMFVNPENLITMFRAADSFLAEHLGERSSRR